MRVIAKYLRTPWGIRYRGIWIVRDDGTVLILRWKGKR